MSTQHPFQSIAELVSLLYDFTNHPHKEEDRQEIARDCRDLLDEILNGEGLRDVEEVTATAKRAIKMLTKEDLEQITRGA